MSDDNGIYEQKNYVTTHCQCFIRKSLSASAGLHYNVSNRGGMNDVSWLNNVISNWVYARSTVISHENGTHLSVNVGGQITIMISAKAVPCR